MGQLFTFTGLQTLKKTLSYAKRGGFNPDPLFTS